MALQVAPLQDSYSAVLKPLGAVGERFYSQAVEDIAREATGSNVFPPLFRRLLPLCCHGSRMTLSRHLRVESGCP